MKKIPVAPQTEKKERAPISTFSKGMMIAGSAVALVLVILTLIDMAGYHLLVPEVIPMGCLLMIALLLAWLAGVLARRRRTERGRRIFTLVAMLLIMMLGLLVSPVVLQYAQIVMPHKYAVIESPEGVKVAVLDVVDNGFASNEATLEMLQRMELRQRAIDAEAAGEAVVEPAEGELPASVKVDENVEIAYTENGVIDYSLEGYDSGAYGYIFAAYPVKLGIFYTSNVESEGLIYRGTESESKIMFEWKSDGSLEIYLENPELGDTGKLSLHP